MIYFFYFTFFLSTIYAFSKKPFTSPLHNILPSTNSNINTRNTGLDERFVEITDLDETLLFKIHNYMQKQKLLHLLLDKTRNDDFKLNYLKHYDFFEQEMGFNITKGGLLDDFFYTIL